MTKVAEELIKNFIHIWTQKVGEGYCLSFAEQPVLYSDVSIAIVRKYIKVFRSSQRKFIFSKATNESS